MAEDGSDLPKSYELNEATVDYLRLRIERQVTDRLVKWIGLPLGSGGLIAIIVGFFFFLPDKMKTMIQTDPEVEKVIRETATDFLKPDKDGGKAITTNVVKAVNDYLAGEQTQTEIKREVALQVQTYLRDAEHAQSLISDFFQSTHGKEVIAAAIQEKIDSKPVQTLIRESIEAALKPAVAALQENLHSSAERTISDAEALKMDSDMFLKGGSLFLNEFLGQKHKDAVMMGLIVDQTIPSRYDPSLCRDYCQKLQNTFGERFLGTLLVDKERRFLALLDPATFEREQSPQLVGLINNGDVSRMKAFLAQFERAAAASLSETTTLANALRDQLWEDIPPDHSVAVVSTNGEFHGVTTWKKLMDAVWQVSE
jgi:hypothetical protein